MEGKVKGMWKKTKFGAKMGGFLDNVEDLFGTRDLYEVLGCSRDQSSGKLRRAYYKAALKWHPDKVKDGNKDKATAKFQALSVIWSILGDEEKKAQYDDYGVIVDDEGTFDADKDWAAYWRDMYESVTADKIDEFKKAYQVLTHPRQK